MSYMNMFWGKVSRAKKIKIYEIGMNEQYNIILYIFEEKLWNVRRLPSENPPESCAFSKPTKVLSNHPLIIENVLQ